MNDAAQLNTLIDYIEQLLSLVKKEEPQQNIKPHIIQMHDFVQDNVEGASQFLEDISKGHFTPMLHEGMENVISSALGGLGQLQWIAVAFSVIAFALQRIRQVSSNLDKFIELFDTMFSLAKRLHAQHGGAANGVEDLHMAVLAIIKGAITCCSSMTEDNLFKYPFVPTDAENLKRIESVHKELNRMILPRRSYVSEYKAPVDTVGIDDKVAEVIKLLDVWGKEQRRAVILHGFGGVGKTTLADYIMSQLDLTGFKHSRIQLDEHQSDMRIYQKELWADLTKERMEFEDCDEDRDKLRAVLKKETTFIFIDNVLSNDQINNLLPSDLSLPPESRMLFTSRDISVAEELRVRNIDCKGYLVEVLPPDAAKKIFRKVVRRSEQMSSAIQTKRISLDQIDAMAEECHGVPLLLQVYARYLARHGCDPEIHEVYEEMLSVLRKGDFSYTDDHLGEKLLYVCHQLRQDAKESFLDVCTYFHGWPKKDVSYILTKREFDALVDGALVNIDSSNKVIVHDVLRAMAIKLGAETRVRSVENLRRALAEKKEIKGMWILDGKFVCSIEPQYLNAVSESLRVLAVRGQIRLTGEYLVALSNLRYLRIDNLLKTSEIFDQMDALKYIVIRTHDSSWSSMALQRLLEIINRTKNIQKLCLDSKLLKLPDDFSLPESLRELDLSYCERLQELPQELNRLKVLQSLSLRYCESLSNLPDGFGDLSSLQSLNMEACWRVTSLPNGFGNLSILQSLNLRRCRSLANLPDGFGNLISLQLLDLRECESLTRLQDGFGNLRSLQSLKMESCVKLAGLPSKFGDLSALQALDLSRCQSLVSLPNEFGNLSALQSLALEKCTALANLPNEFRNLKNLHSINLRGCSSLRGLPDKFSNLSALQSLNLQGCSSLRNLPSGFGKLRSLQHLNMASCSSLETLSDDFELLELLKYLNLSYCHRLEGNMMEKLVKLKNLHLLKITDSKKIKNEMGKHGKREFSFCSAE